MHDSEQEHSGITGCRVTYESTIFYNEANKFSIIVVKTSDPRIPPQACSGRYYGDRMLRFTAVGYELPRTKAVELELDGEWVESKYGYQLQVEQWQEIVPQTADGLLAYLGSGLIKGIGPKTAEDIVATFGPDTLNILDNEPEKLLQIRGITEGKLKDIEESYAESRVLRNLMSLLGPFKITPATALKIYQHFGPACVDILKKCPYDLCQISGFGFKRVDGIVRKTDKQISDLLAILRGISPQNRTENLDSFIPVDIVGTQRNGDSLGFERLQNGARILTLLRRKVGVVQNPVIEFTLFVLAAHQVNCGVDDLHHLLAALQGTGIVFQPVAALVDLVVHKQCVRGQPVLSLKFLLQIEIGHFQIPHDIPIFPQKCPRVVVMRGYVGFLSFEWHKNTPCFLVVERILSITKQREINDFDALSEKNVCFYNINFVMIYF